MSDPVTVAAPAVYTGEAADGVVGHDFATYDKRSKVHTCTKCGAQVRFRENQLLKGPRNCRDGKLA